MFAIICVWFPLSCVAASHGYNPLSSCVCRGPIAFKVGGRGDSRAGNPSCRQVGVTSRRTPSPLQGAAVVPPLGGRTISCGRISAEGIAWADPGLLGCNEHIPFVGPTAARWPWLWQRPVGQFLATCRRQVAPVGLLACWNTTHLCLAPPTGGCGSIGTEAGPGLLE